MSGIRCPSRQPTATDDPGSARRRREQPDRAGDGAAGERGASEVLAVGHAEQPVAVDDDLAGPQQFDRGVAS